MRPSEALELHRDKVREIIARYPGQQSAHFRLCCKGGRYGGQRSGFARRERNGPLGYFELFALERELAILLGCRVEIGTKLKPDAAARARKDLRPI